MYATEPLPTDPIRESESPAAYIAAVTAAVLCLVLLVVTLIVITFLVRRSRYSRRSSHSRRARTRVETSQPITDSTIQSEHINILPNDAYGSGFYDVPVALEPNAAYIQTAHIAMKANVAYSHT